MRDVIHTLALSVLLISAAIGLRAGSELALRTHAREISAPGRELAYRLLATTLAGTALLIILAAG